MVSTADSPMNDSLIQEGSELVEELTGVRVPVYRQALLRAEFERIGGADGVGGGIRRVLAGDDEARARLVSTVTIPETYLFRHYGHFELISELAAQRAEQGRGTRVLSAGCSTGEEVWSASAVLAATDGLPRARHLVVGWELCNERLRTARIAQYTKWSCRNGLKGFDRFFHDLNGNTEPGSELRGMVSFDQVNLVEDEYPDAGPFDAILLRNVAIYWSEETADKVCAKLSPLVSDGGLFLVGPSDPVRLPADQWEHRISQGVRSYLRRSAEASEKPGMPRPREDLLPKPATVPPAVVADRSPAVVVDVEDRDRQRPTFEAEVRPRPTPPAKEADRWADGSEADTAKRSCLDLARSLADVGEYAVAFELLENDEEGQTVDGKLWRGILSLSLEKESEAVRLFRQCVFLRPEVGEYHRWLAVGLEATGRQDEAARCRKNALEVDDQ